MPSLMRVCWMHRPFTNKMKEREGDTDTGDFGENTRSAEKGHSTSGSTSMCTSFSVGRMEAPMTLEMLSRSDDAGWDLNSVRFGTYGYS